MHHDDRHDDDGQGHKEADKGAAYLPTELELYHRQVLRKFVQDSSNRSHVKVEIDGGV